MHRRGLPAGSSAVLIDPEKYAARFLGALKAAVEGCAELVVHSVLFKNNQGRVFGVIEVLSLYHRLAVQITQVSFNAMLALTLQLDTRQLLDRCCASRGLTCFCPNQNRARHLAEDEVREYLRGIDVAVYTSDGSECLQEHVHCVVTVIQILHELFNVHTQSIVLLVSLHISEVKLDLCDLPAIRG